MQRLPRLALLLFCAAYVLPGLFGRDPWKGADQAAFGYMINIAQGKTSWLAPTVAGLPVDTAVLPHWLGALFIALLSPVMDAALAARLAFAGLLTLTLVMTWYTTFQLARTEAAQPLPFAFGGEAKSIDYARALADGALLALIASLGLLQLGHETTPELVQLCAASVLLWGLSAAASRRRRAQYAVLLSLPMLAASGAPAMAIGMGMVGTWLHLMRHGGNSPRDFWRWVAAGTLLSALTAALLQTWAVRWHFQLDFTQLKQLLRLFLWFLWPAWALALWTLWRWRRHLRQPHLALPLGIVLVSMASCIAMGGSDRALMLALPAMAVLAAFALPTLQRSTSAAIDWFSVFFFTICAGTMWVIYIAVQTGVPAKPAANVARLAPDFKAVFSPFELGVAILGTVAWLWLVRWRTGRHRQAMWKSLVLPASGVALCWLLLMTLWLPLLDHGRSYRQWVARVSRHVAPTECVAAPGLTRSALAALEDFGGLRVDGRLEAARGNCAILLLPGMPDTPPGWRLLGRERRIRDKDEVVSVYRRTGP